MSDFVEQMNRFSKFVDEFKAESPRGCAVLCLCVLEESLQRRFERRLPKYWKKFFQRGAFDRNIDTAVALGIVGPGDASIFRVLVLIRNKFSHGALEALTFESPEIAQLIRSMPIPDFLSGDISNFRGNSNRDQFLTAAACLFSFMQLFESELRPIDVLSDLTARQ